MPLSEQRANACSGSMLLSVWKTSATFAETGLKLFPVIGRANTVFASTINGASALSGLKLEHA